MNIISYFMLSETYIQWYVAPTISFCLARGRSALNVKTAIFESASDHRKLPVKISDCTGCLLVVSWSNPNVFNILNILVKHYLKIIEFHRVELSVFYVIFLQWLESVSKNRHKHHQSKKTGLVCPPTPCSLVRLGLIFESKTNKKLRISGYWFCFAGNV